MNEIKKETLELRIWNMKVCS